MSNNRSLKIFVGNVPFQCTREEFIECFKKYNGFIDGDIVNKLNSDNSRGFGFISFKNQSNANEFLTCNEPVILKNRILRFTKYDTNDKKITKNKINDKNYIFVKNISKEVKPDEVRSIFACYGDVGSCFINTNILTGESKGTAVVEMIDQDVFNRLLMLKEIVFNGNQLEVSRWKCKIKKNINVVHNDMYKTLFNTQVHLTN